MNYDNDQELQKIINEIRAEAEKTNRESNKIFYYGDIKIIVSASINDQPWENRNKYPQLGGLGIEIEPYDEKLHEYLNKKLFADKKLA